MGFTDTIAAILPFADNPINFVILPLVGMLIGYFTNWVAVKLLFWPKEPILGVQGVIPKRKHELAISIATSSQYILPDQIEKITKIPIVGKRILRFIEKGVAKKVQNMDNDRLQELVEGTIKRELRFIKLSGGVLGFMIGVIQSVLLEFI